MNWYRWFWIQAKMKIPQSNEFNYWKKNLKHFFLLLLLLLLYSSHSSYTLIAFVAALNQSNINEKRIKYITDWLMNLRSFLSISIYIYIWHEHFVFFFSSILFFLRLIGSMVKFCMLSFLLWYVFFFSLLLL